MISIEILVLDEWCVMEYILIVLIAIPLLSGVVGAVVGKNNEKARDVLNIVFMGLELIVISYLLPEVQRSTIHLIVPRVMGIGIYFQLNTLRYIFVWLSIFIWFVTTIYSTRYLIKYHNRNRYYLFFMWTLSATIGFFMSENLVIAFTFFEIMTFTSYILVIHDEDEFAHRAGISYLAMALAGGFIILLGVFMVYDYTGTLIISEARLKMLQVGDVKHVIATLLIVGFSVKAAIFPLHVWLPEAHPAAPAPASAILSGILVKTGLFGILMTVHMLLDAGIITGYILMSFAMLTMVWGGLLAMFQRNIKRILAYSSMSQAGYILFGIGLSCLGMDIKKIALLGIITHMFNHAMFKVLLFMGAGAIYMIVHELSINKIWGFGRKRYILKFVFLIGMLALIGFPATSGYVGKTIIHHALSLAHHEYNSVYFIIAEIVFYVASAFTVAYMLKIFTAVFIYDNEQYNDTSIREFKAGAAIPMIMLSVMIVLIGMFPNRLLKFINHSLLVFFVQSNEMVHLFDNHGLIYSMLIVVSGFILYKMLIRKFLCVTHDVDNKEMPNYINPTISWISLKDDVYLAGAKWIYQSGLCVIQCIDKWIGNVVTNVRNILFP